MRSFILFSILILTPVSNLAFEESDLATLITNFQTVHQVPGFGVSIFYTPPNGDTPIILAKDYGVKGLNEDESDIQMPGDGSTLFPIASITKLFTAIFTAKILHENFPQNQSDVLDIPIKTLVPDFDLVFYDKYLTDEVTFKDMLSHRICIEVSDTFAVNFETTNKREELIYRLRYAQPTCKFRNFNEYHNVVFLLVGELLGHIEGKPYAELMDKFLQDIGMTSSFVVQNTTQFAGYPNMSSGFVIEDGKKIIFNPDLLTRIYLGQGGGGIVSSPQDMLKFMEFFANKGKVEDTWLVPEGVMEWVSYQTLPLPTLPNWFASEKSQWDDIIFSFGLGTLLGLYKGSPKMSNGGDWPPFLCRIDQYPLDRLGIFSITNGPGFFQENPLTLEKLHNDIFNLIMSKPKEKTEDKSPSILSSNPLAGFESKVNVKSVKPNISYEKVNLEEIEDLLGVYGHPIHDHFTLSYPENQFKFTYGKWGLGNLLKSTVEENRYDIQWTNDIVHGFYALGFTDTTAQPIVYIKFERSNYVIFHFMGMDIEFEKGLTLDKLPDKLWTDCECENVTITTEQETITTEEQKTTTEQPTSTEEQKTTTDNSVGSVVAHLYTLVSVIALFFV